MDFVVPLPSTLPQLTESEESNSVLGQATASSGDGTSSSQILEEKYHGALDALSKVVLDFRTVSRNTTQLPWRGATGRKARKSS
jgi:hypothetical protein